jgi:hypothetical protein
MKKYLTILLFIGCNQKPQEQSVAVVEQPMTATYTTYVNSQTFSALKIQFDSLNVQYKRDTVDKGKRIRQLENNQQAIFSNVSDLFKRTDNLQRYNWGQDTIIGGKIKLLSDSFNIADTFLGGKGIRLTPISSHKFLIETTP